MYLPPFPLVCTRGRVTQALLLNCDGTTPNVDLQDAREVDVVLDVEAKGVFEDVGHVEPAA